MKTFNTKQGILNLKEEEMKEGDEVATMGEVIANVLWGQGIDNPARAYLFAKKLTTNDEVELKAEDVVYIKTQLEKNKYLPAGIIGQIIAELDK